MNRALLLIVVAIACVTAGSAQVAAVPMVYNDSTSTVLVDWNMEGDGNPTVGSAWSFGDTSVVTAASEGISAREGSQILKSYRTGADSGTEIYFGSTPGASDVTTTTLALRCKDAASYVAFYGCSSPESESLAAFMFEGTGLIKYHSTSWQAITGLTNNIGQWNDVSLTHTNGTGNWTVTVNGVSKNITITDGANWPDYLGVLKSWDIKNMNYPSTVYLDAVPEPTSLVLLVTGMIGLLAYAWRKRK
jgi:hypothetical protein